MLEHNGIWLPDGETHLQTVMIGDTYQLRKYKTALEYTPNRYRALDIGAHCGLWSRQMVQEFRIVEAFEPVPEHGECFVKNVKSGYHLHRIAVGAGQKKIGIEAESGSSGDSHVGEGDDYNMHTIDEYNFQDVSFIKIDCEGYEYFIVKGAEETIKENKPTIIVEQKPGKAQRYGLKETQAVDLLKSWGMTLKAEDVGDYILAWE